MISSTTIFHRLKKTASFLLFKRKKDEFKDFHENYDLEDLECEEELRTSFYADMPSNPIQPTSTTDMVFPSINWDIHMVQQDKLHEEDLQSTPSKALTPAYDKKLAEENQKLSRDVLAIVRSPLKKNRP